MRFVSSDKIEIIQDWTSNKAELNEAAENMYIEGGQSAVLDAVYLAAENIASKAKKDASKRNILIVISDWEDRDSFYNRKEVLKKVKESDVEIYTVAFVQQLSDFSPVDNRAPPREKASDLAELFAKETSGAVYFPKFSKKNGKKIKAVVGAATEILNELRMRYRIEYISTNQKSGDKKRKLRVEIADSAKGEKRTVIARETVEISKD